MTSRARDRVERNFASLRWQYMDSLRLPLQQPPVWDARMLLTLANLGNVLVNQANHYRESTSVPITTIVLLLSSTATFCHPGGVLMRDVCLSPFCVVERREFGRLWSCALVHMDLGHICSNVGSVLPELLAMEEILGSARMAVELGVMTGVAHGLYVAYAWFQKIYLSNSIPYYSVGAVGMSSVVFGLQPSPAPSSAANHQNAPDLLSAPSHTAAAAAAEQSAAAQRARDRFAASVFGSNGSSSRPAIPTSASQSRQQPPALT
ncbi:MAG: hypothetical protein WDW38_000314 [Sanguina aurantia]